MAPAVFLLVDQPQRLRLTIVVLARSALVMLAITLPLALWNMKEFVKSAVTLHFRHHFRDDALSFLVLLDRVSGVRLSHLAVLFAILFALLALAFALRRCPRTPAGFAAAVAFTYAVFFAFNHGTHGAIHNPWEPVGGIKSRNGGKTAIGAVFYPHARA